MGQHVSLRLRALLPSPRFFFFFFMKVIFIILAVVSYYR